MTTGAFTDRTVKVDSSGELLNLGSAHKGAAAALGGVARSLMALLSLSWVVRQLRCYRASRGDERQRLKWLMAGGAISLLGFLVSILLSGDHSTAGRLAAAGPFAIAALPLSIGVGILRYRLYEIDRLISRTISYALLTAVLAGVFVGTVVVMTDVLPFSSPVAVAASTLAAAALFNPLRMRTQRLIDRRFNRARYDAEAMVTAFSGRLRSAFDLEAVSGELLEIVEQTVAPAHASLWIRPTGSARLEL